MARSVVAALAALALLAPRAALASGGGADVDLTVPDGVLALEPSTFSSFVGGATPALVEFYAPWCGHCKNLAPEYAKVAALFKSSSDAVVVAKVDADAHKELSGKYDVKGFPTLKWFPAGGAAPEAYEGERSAEAITEFINSRTGLTKRLKAEPTHVLALTPETFDSVMADAGAAKLVEFYAPWCGHCKALAPTYEKVGAAFEGEPRVVVAKVDADKHRSLGERFGVTGFPTIKFFPAGAGKPEDLAEDYTGGREGQDFVTFLNERSGAERTLDGGVTARAGRIASFDALAARFAGAADAAERAAVLALAKAAQAKLEGAALQAKAEAYVRAMTKASEPGKQGYAAKEAARLQGMLASEGVTKAKKTELAMKLNVLRAFTEPAPGAADEEAEEL